MPAGWLQNYLNTIQTLNTFENRNVIRYDLRIFTRIFSSLNWQKNKNIRPRPNKKYSYRKSPGKVYLCQLCLVENRDIRTRMGVWEGR